MNELVARKKMRLSTELEDDELAWSEFRAEAGAFNYDCLKKARKDEHGRVVLLILSDEIPASIAKLTHLKTLKLVDVESLPKELWQLPSLERLIVVTSCIPTLPPDVEDLKEIKSIEIKLELFSARNFSNLQYIGKLKKLEKYIIELHSGQNPGADVANMLASMPSGGLRHLKNLKMEMSGCLPPEIGSLSSLEELDIYRKSGERLPDEIGCLSNLKVFRITSDDMIRSLPPTIGRLQNLAKLTVRLCDEFRTIPGEIGRLENLEELSLFSCFNFTTLPDEIGSLSKLRVLRLNSLGLESFPTTFGSLQNLSDLILIDLHSLKSLPSEIGRLENLEELYIIDCDRVRALPDEIGSLSKLRVLRLALRGVKRLPTTFGSLQNLSDLQLKDCRSLESLPSEILHLPAIENLHIVEVPDKARIEDFFVGGCNLQKSLVNVVLDNNRLGAKNELSTIWRFLSGCPKLERASLQTNSFKHLNGFISAFLQGGDEDNPTESRLRSLDVRERPKLVMFERDDGRTPNPNLLEGEDPEALVALLNTHLRLEYKCASPSFPPQVQYLLDINRCGRFLLEGRGITSIPLSAWCRVLRRTNKLLDGTVERNASALYFLLRNGPALATRGERWE